MIQFKALLDRFRTEKRGTVAVIMAVTMFVLTGFTGFAVDFGFVYYSQAKLQASADAAALAGAQNINVGSGGTATTMATSYSASSGQQNAASNMPVTMASGYPVLKCLTSTGISCSGSDSANAILVKEQATVPVFFSRVLGFEGWHISATSLASAKGGSPQPIDAMIILDTTASMNNSDTSCSQSGSTRLDCALYGVRTLLGNLQPCSSSLTTCGTATNGNVASPLDRVGLMVFPGLTSTSQVPLEYDCSSSKSPTIAKYSASPVYQIIPLSSDFRTSDTAALNTNSNMVIAARGGASGCQQGITAVGGVGTYYADAITAAQTALTNNARAGAQKIIVILTDGDASASSSNMPSGKATNQCHQAITAAASATQAGTWVYSIAYGSSTSSSSSCSTDSPAISACSTLQQVASSSSKFYSDNVGGTSSCVSSNTTSDMSAIFKGIAQDASQARLLSLNTQ